MKEAHAPYLYIAYGDSKNIKAKVVYINDEMIDLTDENIDAIKKMTDELNRAGCNPFFEVQDVYGGSTALRTSLVNRIDWSQE